MSQLIANDAWVRTLDGSDRLYLVLVIIYMAGNAQSALCGKLRLFSPDRSNQTFYIGVLALFTASTLYTCII